MEAPPVPAAGATRAGLEPARLVLARIRGSERATLPGTGTLPPARPSAVGDRLIVSVDDDFVVLAPYASRFPFELLLIPRVHSHSFTEMDERLRIPGQDLPDVSAFRSRLHSLVIHRRVWYAPGR